MIESMNCEGRTMEGFRDYNPVAECWLCDQRFTPRLAGQVICDRDHGDDAGEKVLTPESRTILEQSEGR